MANKYNARGRRFGSPPAESAHYIHPDVLFHAWIVVHIAAWWAFRGQRENKRLSSYDLAHALRSKDELRRHLTKEAHDGGLYPHLLREQGMFHQCLHRPDCSAFPNTDGNTDLKYFVCIWFMCVCRPQVGRMMCHEHYVPLPKVRFEARVRG